MLLLFSIYLLLFNNYKGNLRLGNDERFPLKEDKIYNMEKINHIIENYEKKKLLDLLKSDNYSSLYKINKINEFYGNSNIPKKNNILNGGLLKDWDFEI